MSFLKPETFLVDNYHSKEKHKNTIWWIFWSLKWLWYILIVDNIKLGGEFHLESEELLWAIDLCALVHELFTLFWQRNVYDKNFNILSLKWQLTISTKNRYSILSLWPWKVEYNMHANHMKPHRTNSVEWNQYKYWCLEHMCFFTC